ncbi:MAG: hypothetical protein ACJAXB_001780, partial [Candidatus Endobugula sp.]
KVEMNNTTSTIVVILEFFIVFVLSCQKDMTNGLRVASQNKKLTKIVAKAKFDYCALPFSEGNVMY